MSAPLSQLTLYHLTVLKGAVKLESKGMKRSKRPSAKAIAIQELGLRKRATHEEVIEALEAKIKEGEESLENHKH